MHNAGLSAQGVLKINISHLKFAFLFVDWDFEGNGLLVETLWINPLINFSFET